MKLIDQQLRLSLSKQAAATSICLLILRKDGQSVGLTDHDTDLSFDGYTFRSNPGISLDSLTRSADLAPDHGYGLTFPLFDGIDRDDIVAGRYTEARAELWRTSTDDIADHSLLAVGTIGELVERNGVFELEFRGLKHKLSSPSGRVYQRTCDARLGDARCGVSLAELTVAATIADHQGLTIEVTGNFPAGIRAFDNGVLTVKDGPLTDVQASVRVAQKRPGGASFVLWQSLNQDLSPQTVVELTPGCDKSLETCTSVYGNSSRHRGFPTIPGMDVLAVADSDG